MCKQRKAWYDLLHICPPPLNISEFSDFYFLIFFNVILELKRFIIYCDSNFEQFCDL